MPSRFVRPRNGPPEAVRTILAPALAFSVAPARHWKIALCSLSTGRSSQPEFLTVSIRRRPPQTTLSLLARRRRLPARAAAKVGATPAAPPTACTTTSVSGSSARRETASGPPSTSMSPRPTVQRACSSSTTFEASAMTARFGRAERQTSTNGSTREPPATA